MKYYCGLEASLNNTAICVVNQEGDKGTCVWRQPRKEA